MALSRRHVVALAALAGSLACANAAWSNSNGSPICEPGSSMRLSEHGPAMSGDGGYTIVASPDTITGGPITIQVLQPFHASFKGLLLIAETAHGTALGSFTAPSGYHLLTCGGIAGSAISTSTNFVRLTPVSFTWTPPASLTASDTTVTIKGVVVVTIGPTSTWYVLTPLTLHQFVAGVAPGGTTGVRLAANAPNPFASATLISYSLADWSPVHLAIQDVAGRQVRLLDEGYRPGGRHEVRWDGHDDRGHAMSPGVYFYRLDAPGASVVRRAVMLGR